MATTLTAYTFDELSKEAKEKALANNRHITTEYYEWWDTDVDEFKEDMLKRGFEIEDVWFSGFWSQGDGACFVGSIDVLKWLRATDGEEPDLAKTRSLRYWLKELGSSAAYASITHTGHYYHRHTMYIEVEWNDSRVYGQPEPPKAVKQLLDLESAMLEDARDMALKLYEILESTCEGMMQDDYLTDFLEVNGYLFWENGTNVR